MHLAPLIRDLAIILSVAAFVTFFFRRIRQPVVLGYIIAGLIIGPHAPVYVTVSDLPNIQIWAELGIIFLMFTLGLEFSFRKLAKVGFAAGTTAIFEMSFMVFLGIHLGRIFGWPWMDRLFLGCMIAISSTTIIIKALDELGLKTRQFAEAVFGVLIVEDLVAILMLVALSSIAIEASLGPIQLGLAGLKLLFVISIWVLVGLFLVPRIVRSIGRHGNDEMLTVVSLGLCLSLVAVAASLNYSVALGAFIMGSILSESAESHRIERLIRPLRDTFAAVFFVSVGMLIDPKVIIDNLQTIIIMSAVVMVGKATAITAGSLLAGQTVTTATRTGFSMGQIGEFSFIIATLGTSYKIISSDLYPMIVAVSLITTFATPYMIRISEKVAPKLDARLPESLTTRLARYQVFIQRRGADLGPARELRRRFLRWMASAVLVVAIFGVVSESLLPWIRGQIDDLFYATLIGWGVAVGTSAPFIWTMLGAFRNFQADSEEIGFGIPRPGIVFISRFLTIIIVGGLSMKFFVTWLAMALTVGVSIVFYLAFGRQLDGFYGWIEGQLKHNIREDNSGADNLPVHLAPWNAHMARIKVEGEAPAVGRRLIDLQLRERYGVNIVAIQRRTKTLLPPPSGTVIFPDDRLLFLGSDEQIDSIRSLFEATADQTLDDAEDLDRYKLRQMTVPKDSPLIGKSIRTSGIRNELQSLVVGIERGSERILNPSSDLVLRAGDRLWLVGNPGKIEALGLSHAPRTLKDPRPIR